MGVAKSGEYEKCDITDTCYKQSLVQCCIACEHLTVGVSICHEESALHGTHVQGL